MFEATSSPQARSQHRVKVLLGKRPDEDREIAPYPLAIAPYDTHHGAFDRMMSQYALSGYQHLSIVTDAYVVL